MPRIPLITPETLTDEQRPVYNKIVSGPRGKIQGPLRAALHNPELADAWQALGALLRYRTSLPPRLSELAILVTAVARQSPFEWYAHRIEGEKAGIEPAIFAALLAGEEPPGMSGDDRLVYRFALELNRLNSVRDDTYAAALERFGARTLVELTALVGYYTMVALTLNAHEVPLPPGAEPAFELPQRRGGA
ncbi:carboxymuconolactone decarboxylase family protein [uncultured Hydrogenophaga sp.]|uniref:carboxymuconolactone decarboxylase family protein n=1 Tax=uncultured Hydrogenophaga sp. TaxID=199683 RepID=UPI002583CAA3|nr:carboxymuconolactone decarboxylase family protein [uncultured Hydrogenophaga sp.]